MAHSIRHQIPAVTARRGPLQRPGGVNSHARKPPKPTPPWGTETDFNPEKAWNLIQDLRSDKEKLAARPVLTDEDKQRLTEYNRLVEASQSDLDRAKTELTRWQTEAQTWRDQAVGSRIQALAATTGFADPSDAVGQLDVSKYLEAGGVINDAAIKADLEQVLERKPHWKKTDATPTARPPAPNQHQGSGGGAPSSEPRDQFAALLHSNR
jgi:hypothetical protein